MARMIAFDQEARDAVRPGVGKLASFVRRTLEHRGHAALPAPPSGPPPVTGEKNSMQQTAEGDDDRIRSLEIEFIGGPYDGHKKVCFTRPVHLPTELVWFVCEDAFRLLDGKDHRPGGSFTSVALYELEAGNGACRYRFACAISVKELTLHA